MRVGINVWVQRISSIEFVHNFSRRCDDGCNQIEFAKEQCELLKEQDVGVNGYELRSWHRSYKSIEALFPEAALASRQ